MALKIKITKEEFEKLPEAVKFEYKQDGDGYKLDVNDTEVAAEMRRAKDREKQRADEAEAELNKARERISQIEGDDARKRGDIATIEKSWAEKLEKAKKEGEEAVKKLKSHLETVMVDAAVNEIASEIFVKPSRDSRLIKDRVYIDYDGETPVIRVRDKDGKASALTLADLKKETLDNADFADILVGSKASGSGASGGKQGGGAAKQPSEFTEQERTDLFRNNRAEFDRLFPQAT
jgi:hypothetical protein